MLISERETLPYEIVQITTSRITSDIFLVEADELWIT
jgi:hypothetical protein